MLILAIVQALFAVSFVAFGLIALFAIGITGLFILIPAVLFAASGSMLLEKSRAAVIIALAADAMLGKAMVNKIGAGDVWFPYAALALMLTGVVGVLLDWRSVRSAPWIWQRAEG